MGLTLFSLPWVTASTLCPLPSFAVPLQVPYKYDLSLFCPMNAVAYDHPGGGKAVTLSNNRWGKGARQAGQVSLCGPRVGSVTEGVREETPLV